MFDVREGSLGLQLSSNYSTCMLPVSCKRLALDCNCLCKDLCGQWPAAEEVGSLRKGKKGKIESTDAWFQYKYRRNVLSLCTKTPYTVYSDCSPKLETSGCLCAGRIVSTKHIQYFVYEDTFESVTLQNQPDEAGVSSNENAGILETPPSNL